MQSHDTNLDTFILSFCFAAITTLWFVYWVIPNDNRNMAIAQCQLEEGDRSYESFVHCSELVDASAQ